MSVSQNQYVVRNHHGYLRFCFYAAERRIRGFIESRPEQATWFDEEALAYRRAEDCGVEAFMVIRKSQVFDSQHMADCA
jgi:hypothetical protein